MFYFTNLFCDFCSEDFNMMNICTNVFCNENKAFLIPNDNMHHQLTKYLYLAIILTKADTFHLCIYMLIIYITCLCYTLHINSLQYKLH